MSDATSNEKPRSLERWMAAALDAQMTASGLKDALQRAGFRIAELEAEVKRLRNGLDRRMATLEDENERLRELTRMDLDDAREWVQAVASVTAQRDRLAEALRTLCAEIDSRRHAVHGSDPAVIWARAALAELEEKP